MNRRYPETDKDKAITACAKILITSLTIARAVYNYSEGYIAEKAMALHSSTLAWKIPWMEEPGGLPSMGSHRVGHD